MGSDRAVTPLGALVIVILVGTSLFVVFQAQPDTPNEDSMHIEAYPYGPEKPASLTPSNVVDYAVTYEERLFYNDLLASQNHSFDTDERVIADCTAISVSNDSTDEFHVQLDCRGGVTDSSRLSDSDGFTYSATYRITENTTEQTGLRNYPFETDRRFNNERNYGNSSR